MKLFALFLLLPAMARCVTVETLPQSEFADKEVFDCGTMVEGRKPGFAVEVR